MWASAAAQMPKTLSNGFGSLASGLGQLVGKLTRKEAMNAYKKHSSPSSAVAEARRLREQGYSAPIKSKLINGLRTVSVADKVFSSEKWGTFHEFLIAYFLHVFDDAWIASVVTNKISHPLISWHQNAAIFISTLPRVSRPVSNLMPGALDAILSLAYDLYSIAHNFELESRLLQRLKYPTTFLGAAYELHVAAILIRAGFEILKYEDENDRSTTHCEFTVRYRQTGKSFSVECKRRQNEGGRSEFRSKKFIRTLGRALKKQSILNRIIFIDLYFSDVTGKVTADAIVEIHTLVRKLETNTVNSDDLPSAYIFLTNENKNLHPTEIGIPGGFASMSFKMETYRSGRLAKTLHELVEWDRQHWEIRQLERSLRSNSGIPGLFDMDELSFELLSGFETLQLGNQYILPDEGSAVLGTLIEVGISEPDGTALCIFSVGDDQRVLKKFELSSRELDLWRRHPDTYFGNLGPPRGQSPLDLYHFFLKSYAAKTKEQMIEHLSSDIEIEILMEASADELRSICAERTTEMLLRARAESGEAVPIMSSISTSVLP